MFEGWKWREWVLLVWSVVAFFAAMTAIYPGWPRLAAIAGSERAADWVQAVGSVLAILLTGALFLAQGRREAEARAAAAKALTDEQSEFARVVVKEVLREFNAFHKRLSNPSETQAWRHHDGFDDTLEILKLAALGPMYPAGKSMLLRIRAALLTLHRMSRNADGRVAGGSRWETYSEVARTRIVEALTDLGIAEDPDAQLYNWMRRASRYGTRSPAMDAAIQSIVASTSSDVFEKFLHGKLTINSQKRDRNALRASSTPQ